MDEAQASPCHGKCPGLAPGRCDVGSEAESSRTVFVDPCDPFRHKPKAFGEELNHMTGLRVAVTGTDSFLGRGLVERLASDPAIERVLAVEHRPPAQRQGKVHYRRVDLLHPRSGEQLADALVAHEIDAFVHTAFLARPVHRGGWAHELEATGTRHVVAAVEAANTRKLVLRSTTLGYGALPSNPNQLKEAAPLRGAGQSSFIADKAEAEAQATRLATRHPERIVTLLRLAPILGYSADTIASLYLGRRLCPTLLGFDPLVQLLHEEDAFGAFRAALLNDVRGAVNVAAPGVLPLSDAIRLAGSRPVPLPGLVARSLSESLWAAQVGRFPPEFIAFLRFLCVADTTRMESELRFVPRRDVREAISLFAKQRGGQGWNDRGGPRSNARNVANTPHQDHASSTGAVTSDVAQGSP